MDKGMLASLVRGMDPAYEIMDDPLIKSKGYYSGGHSDRWIWNHGFENSCTEEDLWATYELLKNPRKYIKQNKESVRGSAQYIVNKLKAVEGVTYVELEDYFDWTASIYVCGGKDEDIALALYTSLPMYMHEGLKGDHLVSIQKQGFENTYKINRRQRNV